MPKINENPKDRIYIAILEAGSILCSYRDLSHAFDIPLTTVHDNIQRLIDENKITVSNDQETTLFEAVRTVGNPVVYKQDSIFDEPIRTEKFKFTPRIHRLIDYLKEHGALKKENRIDGMKILHDLKEYYLNELQIETHHMESYELGMPEEVYYKEVLGPKRQSISGYISISKDSQINNEHCDIRQVLICSVGGRNGGYWIASKEDGHQAVRSEFISILSALKRVHLKRKFLEKDGNYRMVFAEEKDIMEILK